MSFDALAIWQIDWWHQPEVECLNLKVGYQAIRAFHFFDARAGAHTGSSRLSIYISECIYECGIDEATRVLVGPARRRGCGNAPRLQCSCPADITTRRWATPDISWACGAFCGSKQRPSVAEGTAHIHELENTADHPTEDLRVNEEGKQGYYSGAWPKLARRQNFKLKLALKMFRCRKPQCSVVSEAYRRR